MKTTPSYKRPDGKPEYTAPWFKWFLPTLTLPEGGAMRWEGHTLLMTDEFFTPDLVHLLVVIPKNNQKTTWEAALAIWQMVTVAAPRVYAGAADLEQANELYGFAAHFVQSKDWIAKKLVVRESKRLIRPRQGGGVFKTLASDDSKQKGKKQGKNMTGGLLDELHAHENDNMFTDFRSAGFKRRDAAKVEFEMTGDPRYALWHSIGKLATITTAGWNMDSALGKLLVDFLGDAKAGIAPKGTVEAGLRVLDDGSVEHHPDGRLTIARFGSGRNVLLMWAARDDDDISDPAVVKLCNPASTVTVDSIEDARDSLTPWAFARYRANRWTLAFESWIPAGSWDALYSAAVPTVEHRLWNGASDAELDAYVDSLYPEGAEIVGFIDMARYRDCAAITLLGAGPGGRLLPRAVVWKGSQDSPIPYGPVYRAARRLNERYSLKALGIDAKYLDEFYATLDLEGLPIENIPSGGERWAPAAADLRQAILSDQAFEHDGDPILAAHIMAAKARDVGSDAFRLEKSKANGPPIDACVALAGALQLAGDFDGGDDYVMFFPGSE